MGLFSSSVKISIPAPGPEETQLTGNLADLVAKLKADLDQVRTPEDLDAAVAPIFDLAARRGGEDIQRRGIELAGARGLNLSDTPLAAPLLREQRELTEGLAGARANAILDLQQRALSNRLQLGQLALGGVGTLGGIRTRQTTSTVQPSTMQNIGTVLDLIPKTARTLSGIGSLFA